MNNTLIFAIGSIGTKLINILMVPIYTYLMTKSQYGSVDLFITTINMLAPIVGFSIADAVFRFTLDDEYDSDTVLSNGVALTLFGTVAFVFASGLFYIITGRPNLLFIAVMVMANVFVMLFLNYFRGTGLIRLFIVFSLIFTALNALLTAFGIIYGPTHVTGFIIGYILSAIITIFLMVVCSKCYRQIKIAKIKKPIMRELLMYSVPLIPNAFAWWFTQDAAKFFILIL
ncbi:Polysaccharide biosynthesis protein [Weissella viridescens]|uniref:Polysaccharide biosynthesis protein n=1 Tax=Weissella viridescens TaxID=1629 RepID=A0A380NYB1_WEIVI|nr:Polysaccharide biosynthesis protein [Weissella viridescens]